MTVMIREVYEALLEAGASEEKAAQAAEAIQSVREEERLRRIEQDITELKGDMKLLRWMISFNLALTAAVLIKLLV
jgi:glycine cleavage system aminomethyltransferase T